jgi:hypothetical protein
MGVAHAPAVAQLGCDCGADFDTGGTERRRSWTPKLQTSKNMNVRFLARGEHVGSLRDQAVGSSDGNGAPEFRFPHPVPLAKSRRQ